MRPSPNLCLILSFHNSVTPNISMAALQILQSLEIHDLCNNDAVGYYAN